MKAFRPMMLLVISEIWKEHNLRVFWHKKLHCRECCGKDQRGGWNLVLGELYQRLRALAV
jgi:hypothetical protein